MKIVLISALYPPYARGGAERVTELTARGLKDAGHEVSVITAGPCEGYLEPKTEEHDGVRVIRFWPPNLFFYRDIGSQPFWKRLIFHIRDAGNAASAGIVRGIILREKPDAVITENIKGLGFMIPRVLRELNIRHIHIVHDIQLIEPSGLVCLQQFHSIVYETVEKSAIRQTWAGWMRRLWGSPDVIVCPSKWVSDVHRAWGFFPKSRMEVIPNPIKVPSLKFQVASLSRLLFIGQLEAHKGIFDLIEAAKLVKADFILDILGAGSARPQLIRMIAGDPRFVLHGRVDPERIWELCSRAAATVVPSRCLENAPTTISESLACGTPVIATRVGGIPEMIRDGENGWLVPPGDKSALATAMARALKQKNDPAMRDRARQSIAGRTIADYVQKISSLLLTPGAPERV